MSESNQCQDDSGQLGGEQEYLLNDQFFAQTSWSKAVDLVLQKGRNMMGLHATDSSDILWRFFVKNA